MPTKYQERKTKIKRYFSESRLHFRYGFMAHTLRFFFKKKQFPPNRKLIRVSIFLLRDYFS